jgi:SAM-dependent methyltransferase
MDLVSKQLADLIRGMRSAYARGENAMAYAREALRADGIVGRNQRLATLIAYDLQAGSYVEGARANPSEKQRWCRQLAELIAPVLPKGGSLLELGVGEATTLAGVLAELRRGRAFGFDISWSRINVANNWLRDQSQVAELFVGDLLNIPLADNSIDVIYSSHSLEPNGGREEEAIAECLRVARQAVVLIEPLYELASTEAQSRMRYHGYVRGLRETAERLGAIIVDYRLLEHTVNPLNPSGVLAFRKVASAHAEPASALVDEIWKCPLSGVKLEKTREGFFAPDVGITYPILAGVPLLRAEHAVVASKFENTK